MKVIYNPIIPFKRFKAINLFGVLFVRKGSVMSKEDMNHEAIYTAQMKEMMYIFFYWWYLVEWIVRLFGKGNAYRNISLEREAYSNQNNAAYLMKRKHFAWMALLTDKTCQAI